MKAFKWFKIEQVPRARNIKADSLERLAFGLEDEALGQVPIEILAEPSTKDSTDHVMSVDSSPSWIDLIFEFLTKGRTLGQIDARRINYQANRYTILNSKLYRRGYAMPYLRCLRPDEAEYVIREIHEGVYNNHSGKRSLA